MKTYTYHSAGTVTPFNPDSSVKGPDGAVAKALDIHLELVEQADRRDVYILDHKGREVLPAVA